MRGWPGEARQKGEPGTCPQIRGKRWGWGPAQEEQGREPGGVWGLRAQEGRAERVGPHSGRQDGPELWNWGAEMG